jgi:hypothetical protein
MGLWDKVKGAFASGNGDDERLRFMRDVRDIAEHVPGVISVHEVPEDFMLELRLQGDDEPHRVYLANTWHEMRQATAAERAAHMERFLLDLFASRTLVPSTWENVRRRLIPVVRSGSTFLVADQRLPVLKRPFLPYLFEAVAIDWDASMQYVTDGDLETWGKTASEVFDAARRNLAAVDDDVSAAADVGPGTAFRVATNDAYESSRLLLPGWLASFRGRVSGAPIAVVPDRATVIVGGADDPALVRRMLVRAEEITDESPRYLTSAPYTVDAEDRVVPWAPPEGHACAAVVRHAQIVLAGTEYKAQKAYLDAVHERDGIDLYVASFGALTGKDGVEHSFASWGEGIDTLLPEAELLAMGAMQGSKAEQWMALVPWTLVQRLAGECFELDPNCDPVRYRVRTWPRPAAIAEIRRHSEVS